ncbi:MAG: bifunctional enoyl-CoA hydratase/phosphate acetyltransferase [Chloroflexi bacterium]|nr:bifunctional enoyl-CoA hydratase/phosphate acetyltransferase [Chloroflexota bacterium]
MAVATLEQMVAEARRLGPVAVAVAAADDPEVLAGMAEAQQAGLAVCTLIGDQRRIEQMSAGLDLVGAAVIHEPEVYAAAQRAVDLARAGQVQVVVKGQLKTGDLLRACLDRNRGLRRRSLLAHVGVFEIRGLDRLLYVSDSGVVLAPNLEQKLEILRLAVEVAHRFGLEKPRVAVLAASETLRPGMTVGIEALALARMAQQGAVEDAWVDGPLSLDAAVLSTAAAAKGVRGPVAGQADVLIVPSVESGNTMAKAIQYLGGGHMAGLVVGAKVPIIINSRSDNAETRFHSLAMAVLLSREAQGGERAVNVAS